MKQTDRLALLDWEKYKEDIARATPVDRNMTAAEREKHREYLEKHPIEWIKFFFPNYAKYEFADFQKKAIRRIIAHDEWFEVLSWSRELAKSTVTMFIVMNLTLTGRKKNVILTSNSKDNAVRLLNPYRANLEANGRIMAYYGKQELPGSWTEDEFTTKGKVSFRALGAGQSPRGSRNEAIRPDVLLVDDFDTDEDTKNPDIIQKRWDWWENALYPTRSISEPTLVIFCGNIIAKDCCVVRAGEMADSWDIVNIRDKNGFSTWPEKNSEEDIDRTLSKISKKAAQGEYSNNPISVGEVFENIAYGKVPALSKFKFLVVYGDRHRAKARVRKANPSRRFRSVANWVAGFTSSRLSWHRRSMRSLLTGMSGCLNLSGARPMSIATWRTTNCRTLSSSRCSNRWWQRCAANRRLRCSSGATRRRRRTRLRVSRPTLNRSTAKGTSSSTRLNGTIRT